MSHLQLALLGPLHMLFNDGSAPHFAYGKVRALFVYLAAEHGRPHRREALAELLWPDMRPENSRASLRQALTSLRQTFPDSAGVPWLLITRETVQLNPAARYELDTAAFTHLIATCEAHRHASPAECAPCMERYAAAARLYRGPFADGLDVPGCPEFDEWLSLARERYAQAALAAFGFLADHAETQGDMPRALAHARRQLEIDPWRDATHLQVMRLLAAQGHRAAALEHYQRYQHQLETELGIEPAAELAALHAQLLATDAQSPTAAPDEPPAATYPLPMPSTSFVGREAELGELVALLHNPACRLLTLLGPGGIGKTRLAQRLAETASAAFRHGVCWVPLADVTSASQLAQALARALDPAYSDGQEPRAHMLAFARPRQLLLVLDSFEHVIEGAAVLHDLLAAAPRLKILITSRERLRIGWEWVFDVAGLPFPPETPHDAHSYPAIELLVTRARQVHRPPEAADMPAAARIAQLTHGMPLAIELAAAATRRYSYAEVAASLGHTFDLLQTTLRDVPARHRSMRAALEHSWGLLAPHEQHALARLSVFREGCAAEAAGVVAGADEQLLDDLADKSLLQRGDGRYMWHELTRQFAYEQLLAGGAEPHAGSAHLGYFAELAQTASGQLMGEQQSVWLERLEREHANIRAALEWGLAHELPNAARLAGMLWRFWWMRGRVSEGRGWLARVLEHGAELDMAPHAQVLKGAGALAYVQGDYEIARGYQEGALEQERALGNQRGMANALHNLALTLSVQGHYQQAGLLFVEALETHRGLGNDNGVAVALDGLAELAIAQAEYSRAREYLRQSLALHQARGDQHSATVTRLNMANLALLDASTTGLADEAAALLAEFRALGNTQGIAISLHLLGKISLAAGDMVQARAYLVQALELLQSDDLRHDLAACLVSFAMLAGHAGKWERAARICGAALAICAAGGGTLTPPDSIDYEQTMAQAREAVGAQADAAWAAGQALSKEAAIREALAEGSAP